MVSTAPSTALVCSILAATLGVALPPTTAFARTATGRASAPATEDPEALSAEAVEAFGAQHYDEAITLFERAYAADPQPNYLFNIGRVYEEKGELTRAIEYYAKFVRSPGVDIEARENATARLEVLNAALAAVEPEPDGATEATTEDEPAASGEPGTDDPTPRAKKLRLAGYVLLGVGGAGLIVGGVFGGLALGKTRDADDTEFVDDAAALRRDARSDARVADAMYITGGVLAAAGLVMVLTTLRKGPKAKRAASARTSPKPVVAPLVGAGRLGIAMQGRF